MTAELLRSAYRQVPPGLRRAILVRRRSRYWLAAGILFIHVPKAAGTSFNQALYGRFIGHPHARDVRRWGSRAVNALPSFSVVRNPWDRLVSAYRFARAGRGVGEGYRAGMWRRHLYQGPEFESFDRFVRQWLAPKDVGKLDGVFQPQTLFVCGPGLDPLVDHVGRLEDLAPTYRFIEEAIGTVPAVAKGNRSGESVDYRTFYTPDLVRVVGEIYRDDVSRFGYDF
ncbi:MAG TPA: sulfotransferase family 2 domain-containing protein [Allosphingosinicella sp.]|nr:sulfotransferase family 2 domain-containing protein [Allosphingosinicella sp.]